LNQPKRVDIPVSWRRFPPLFRRERLLKKRKANLLDALKLVLECQRELAEKNLSPNAVRETLEFAEA
jgi:hypothetical protein